MPAAEAEPPYEVPEVGGDSPAVSGSERSGPSLGLPRRDRFYATRLRQLARIEVEESEAETLWRNVLLHRRELRRRLARDVGQRVALLDYILNVRHQVLEPQIVERSDLEAMEHQAIGDSLTGLYNRHYFEAALVREVERGKRYGSPLSLLLLDLDGFKEINDGHGHAAGDEVLRMVGLLIQDVVRAADVACRYGGDEFAVLVPDASHAEALVVAERIRADIAASFDGRQGPRAITASVGVCPLEEHATARSLFVTADRALYEAKRGGGNRVVSALSRPPGSPVSAAPA